MKKPVTLLLYSLLVYFSSCQYNDLLTDKSNPQGNGSVLLIKATVKMAVGGIVYDNLDGHIRITGYDINNINQWIQDYNLTGPLDTLAVQNGFHHYSIELINKWGVNDIQTPISAKDIWDGRADGPLPVTYVLGGSIKAKKLSSYVTSVEVNVPGGGTVYQPQSRETYTYNGDRLEYIHHETYNPQTFEFEETGKDAFTYDNKSVSKIVTTLHGQPYAEYQYGYGPKNKIMETLHFDNDLVWTVTFSNNNDSSTVRVNYNLSNGSSFSYEFDVIHKDIANDKTVQSDQVCNQGHYAYDKNINPFRHLGYIDFNLQNWSVNNKLAEQVDYLACSYPTLVPLFYDYTYDQDGYPVKKITKYKSGSNQNSAYHTAVDFYYE